MTRKKRTSRARAASSRRRGSWLRAGRRVATIVLALLVGLPVVTVLVLRCVDPPTSAFMLDLQYRGWQLERPRPWVAHRWLDWSEMPPALALAVVASEDQRFVTHHGFDWVEVRAALAQRERSGRLRGASTISQQTAKNLFLWPGRSWLRKAAEAGLTLLLELLWPKQRILEVYLNIAQFGPRIFGVAAAAQAHFEIEPAQLNERQMSLLAAMLPAPNRYRPGSPGTQLERRAAGVRAAMRKLGPSHLKTLR